MKYLSEKYWGNFKEDGKLFEQLSRVLIEYEYNQTDFYIVGGPNDKGKDIVKKISLLDGYQQQIWAQCKFYHRTLSFDDISYTLLMAYLKNTNQILIFSYSKVSKYFEEELDEYRIRTAKNVIVYADETLESLIIKHRKQLINEHADFFPDLPDVVLDDTNAVRTDYQIFVDNRRVSDKKISLNINSICELYITITNKSSTTQDITLSCIKNRIEKRFIFLNGDISIQRTLLPYRSFSVKTFIKLRQPIANTTLPDFLLTVNDESKKIHSSKKVTCRWLADTTLIGTQYRKALERIYTGLCFSHFHLIYIYGKSGVGKSRLLKEAQPCGVKEKKKIVCIDSEKEKFSCHDFVELLCSKMTLLPVFHKDIAVLSTTNEHKIEYAAHILYDASFDLLEEWETVAKFIAFLMSEENFVLIIDNVQNFDRLAIQVLEKIIFLLKNTSCESDIILGINTDYVFNNSSFGEFFQNLRIKSGNANEYFTDIPLTGFDKNDAELFIRECLSYDTSGNITMIQYNNAIKKIVDHCGNNPFYLQQYLLYLEQCDILQRSEGTAFFFYKVEDFLDSFHVIPPEIEDLIKAREKIFFEKISATLSEDYTRLINLLNLTKALPLSIYYRIIKNQDLIDILLDLGFLSLTEDSIIPIHSFFAIYFKKKYRVEGISDELLKAFISTVDHLQYERLLSLPYFWSKYRLNQVNSSDVQYIMTQINTLDFDCSAYLFCLKDISIVIDNHINRLHFLDYVHFYKSLFFKVHQTLGMENSIYFYKRFLQSFLENCNINLAYVEECLPVITEGLISLINLDKYKQCLRDISGLESVSAAFAKTARMKYIYYCNSSRIMIYNRTDQVSSALSIAEKNMAILSAKDMDVNFKRERLYSAMRAVGNIYFYSTVAYEHRKEIVESWSNAFLCYKKYNSIDVDCDFAYQPKVAAFAKGLAADMIAEKDDAADRKAKFFENALNHMGMLYYEMQIRLLLAIFYTWKWGNTHSFREHFSVINHYIDQTLDLAAVYGRELTTINAFQLRAAVFFLANDYEKAFDNYSIVAKMLNNYLKESKDYIRWYYFWIDYARVMKKAARNNPILLDQIPCQEIKELIKKISVMSPSQFDEYDEHYIPQTALTDRNFSISFPKI